jgi:hypothetical protein
MSDQSSKTDTPPVDSSALTPAENQKVINFLNSKAPNLTCSACGGRQFTLAKHLVTGVVLSGGDLSLGGTSYPMVLVVCQNCANTLQFAAIPMKLAE